MFEDLFTVGVNDGASMGMSQEQAEELLKTVQIGHANGLTAPNNLVGYAGLQAESVDATVRAVTFDEQSLVLWPSIPQDRAFSMVEQYNRKSSYGDGGSPYITESGSPAMNDSEMSRHASKVVIMSTRRGVSLVSTLVRYASPIDVEAAEQADGTLWLLEKLERELYKGNTDYSNAGKFDGSIGAVPIKMSNLALYGLDVQIRAGDTDYSAQASEFDGFGNGTTSVIKSLASSSSPAGDILDETTIGDHATLLLENNGRPKVLDWQPRNMQDFVNQFFPKERVNALGVQDGRAGYVVRTLSTVAGDIALRPNIFLRPKGGKKSKYDRSTVPGAPSALKNNATQSVVTGSGNALDQAAASSLLQANDQYVYEVTSCNEQGEGVASLVTVAATITATGNNVTFKISDPSSGATPTHYAVYRSDNAASTTRQFIGFVARSASGTTLFTDLGNRVQGSSTCYLLDMRPKCMIWKQLAPMLKIGQPPVGTAKEFLLWLAGTLQLATPRFCGIFENVIEAA